MTRTTRPAYCPECGIPASGNFCSGCGVSLGGATCPKCDSRLSAGSKFCGSCGHAFGAARVTAARERVIAVLVAAAILGVVALFTIGPFGSSPSANRVDPGVPRPPGDLSFLPDGSLRGEADRHFDQAMRAYEGGDSTTAASAAALALGAYSQLPGRDADARLHMGLLYETSRDYEAILAQADSLELFYPNHLFAYLLRQRAHSGKGDSQALKDTYRGFLEVYDQEIATDRQEYQAHARLINSFRTEATQALGN